MSVVQPVCDCVLARPVDVDVVSVNPLPWEMKVAAPLASSLPLTVPVVTVPEEVMTTVRFPDG